MESDGSFSATVPARNAIAVHTGALGTANPDAPTIVTVTFQETATTVFGEVRTAQSSSAAYPLIIGNLTRISSLSEA